jgi:hypothetical protein
VWVGFIRLWKGTSGGVLWPQQWTFFCGYRIMQRKFRLADKRDVTLVLYLQSVPCYSRRMHSGCTGRDTVQPRTGHEDPDRDLRDTSGLGGHPHTPAALARVRDPASIVQEVGRPAGAVWTVVENLDPIGIRSSDYPTCSEPLYRLRYQRQLEWHWDRFLFDRVLSFRY